jgi:hypothetical protein
VEVEKQQDAHFCGGTSKFRGVSWHKAKGIFRMAYKLHGKLKQVQFGGEEDAAHAYDRIQLQLFGR